jgi:hypothetical protein
VLFAGLLTVTAAAQGSTNSAATAMLRRECLTMGEGASVFHLLALFRGSVKVPRHLLSRN